MEQEVVLDVKVKNQSLKQQLREAVLEAQALQERFGATSQEAIAAAKKVANLKEEISDMNDVFKAFNPEQKFNALIGVTQGIAGGFQAVTGAMQLFGSESKDVEKALLKVQAATAFAEGLNNIRGLGDSFKNLKLMVMDGIKSLGTLRGALIASGIGIFAVAVGAIVTNWKELKAWIDKTFPSLAGIGDMFDKIKKVAFGTLSSIVEGFKIVGEVIGNVFTGEFSKAVDIAGTFGQRVSQAYTKGYKGEEQKLADERAAVKLEALNKEHARTLKVLEAQGKDTYAFKKKLLEDELKLIELQKGKETDEYKDKQNEILVLTEEHYKKLNDESIKSEEEFRKKRHELISASIDDERSKLMDSYQTELNDIKTQYAKKDKQREELETLLAAKYEKLFADLAEKQRKQAEEEAAKDREKQRELLQKNFEEKQAFDLGLLDIELQNLKTKGQLTTDEEIRIENEKFALLKSNKDLSYLELQKIEADHAEKIKGINDKAAADSIAAKQRERDAIFQLAQETLNGLVSLAELGIKNEKKLEKFRKAAALVQIGIDTAKAISSAVAAASSTSITPVDLAIKIASSIGIVLANIAKAKQLLSASSSGSTPNLSNTPTTIPTPSANTTAGGVTGMQAPQQVGQGIANANAINNALNNPNMIRAVVVETDITDSQRRVRGIEDRATFG